MAIAPTGAIYKTLTFDGVSSADFGVYITGEAVFNAPERDVEMVTIPGRNGTFALDNGRFQNIEVSYPAGIFADTEADFAEAVSEFRNFLCSRNGYVRLEDDYNPSEYRMAVYKSGLEVTPALLKAGEFTLTFDCKPQRWLTSGETAVTVDSGDTITNPTRFESGPMLEVEGYGNIAIGDDTITIEDVPIGDIQISSSVNTSAATLSVATLNTGDDIYKTNTNRPFVDVVFSEKTSEPISLHILSVTNGTAMEYGSGSASKRRVRVLPSDVAFVKGTASTITTTVSLRIDNQAVTLTVTTAYNGSNKITLSRSTSGMPSTAKVSNTDYGHPEYFGNSTKSALPETLYIDLDIGEAYAIIGSEVASVNNVVSIPPELPKLAVGDTEITYDNTITSLDVKPRWWKV